MTSVASRVVGWRETMIRPLSCALLLALLGCEPDPTQPNPATDARPSATIAPTSDDGVSPSHSTRPTSAPKPRASTRVPPNKPRRYAPLSDEEVKTLVTPRLAGEAIAHPPFRGPFGPAQDTVVVITKLENGDFGGFVLVSKGAATERRDLPILQESWPGESVEALGFVPECDGDSVDELVVISKHRSASASTTVATVIDYDGYVFTRQRDVERLTAKAKTIAEVRETLAARTFLMHIDGVPVRMLPTIRPDTTHAYLAKLMGVAAKTNTDAEVAFDYAETSGRAPAQFVFSFNDSKVLTKITIGATHEQGDAEALNPTGRKLVTWLTGKAGDGTTDGTKTSWKLNGWRFVLDRPPGAYTIEISPR